MEGIVIFITVLLAGWFVLAHEERRLRWSDFITAPLAAAVLVGLYAYLRSVPWADAVTQWLSGFWRW